MTPKVWNILHDGRIKRINGSIPGDIEFLIEIKYLRRMLSPDGDSIFLMLKDCSCFEYQGYAMAKEDIKCSDFKDFLKQEPIIISAKDKPGKLKISYVSEISATDGYFWIKYSDFSVRLDNGKNISCAELSAACDKYWDNWEKEAKKKAARCTLNQK